MTRQKRRPRLLGRQHSQPGTPRTVRSSRYKFEASHSRQNFNYRFSPSTSPCLSSHSIEKQSPQIWQRSSSPAIRQLGDKYFRYHDLDWRRKEIRLLRILPETTSIVKCELFPTSLDNPCPYIAISYAWGDGDNTETIILDGHEFVVTESLKLALERLRSRHTPVIVWADAICINQENTEERNLQVQEMTNIYQKAVEVAIWLGPEADGSKMALRLLHDLYQYSNQAAQIRAIIESPDSKPYIQALVALFDREYWGRLWVVQEVINGNNITVYCGASSLPWDYCLVASAVLLKYSPYLIVAFLDVYGTAAISASGHSCPGQLACGGPAVLRDLRKDGRPAGLLEVLLYHQEKSCREPRDRVYSLLGILSPFERSQFPVNYNRSVREVYIDVVDYLLTTTQSLDVICASINFPVHQNIDGLPSWCPDWSQRRRILPIWHRFRGFSAAGQSKPEFTFSNNSKRKILDVSAILLDKITLCGVPLNPPICEDALLISFFEWRLGLVGAKGYGQEDHEAFCRTLSCGQIPDTWTPKDWLKRTYGIFSLGLLRRFPALILDPHLQSYARDFSLPVDEQRSTLSESFTDSMTGRCFAITRSGLLCLGSGALQVEDLVCVPLGCSTPIILRKRGEGYTFIGDVYVDGYMDGKAINDWRDGRLKLETFPIQ